MARKIVLIVYHYGAGNEQIADTDFEKFFMPFQLLAGTKPEIEVDHYFCPNPKALGVKFSTLVKNFDEIYLHFSGHGTLGGIPYNELIFENQHLVGYINHPAIRFCFFSSCSSAELVRLANEEAIPIVIGTKEDNAIVNTYAIQFQNKFYQDILNGWNFQTAFRNAYNEIQHPDKPSIEHSILIRDASGKPNGNPGLNALQINFTSKEKGQWTLIPMDFVEEIKNTRQEQNILLTWFDQIAYLDDFKNELEKSVLKSGVKLINIPSDKLNLLNNPDTNRALTSKFSRFVIFSFSNQPLPVDLILHLKGKDRFKNPQYRPVLAIHNDASADEIFIEYPLVIKEIPKSCLISFEQMEELFADRNLNELINSSVPYSIGRSIVLQLKSNPSKKEMDKMPPQPNQFVRFYFARYKNEMLIYFLSNWMRNKTKELKKPVIAVENVVEPTGSILGPFEETLSKYFETQTLKKAIIKMIDEGVIIVVRSHQQDKDFFQNEINMLAELYNKFSDAYEGALPLTPTRIVFLVEDIIEPALKDMSFVHSQMFTSPDSISETWIEDWIDQIQNSNLDDVITKEIRRIAGNIKPQDYAESCPSKVYDYICENLNLPKQKITRI